MRDHKLIFWLSIGGAQEREVSASTFIAAERRCGFTPSPGREPFATAGFSRNADPEVRGRIAIRGKSLSEIKDDWVNASATQATFDAAYGVH